MSDLIPLSDADIELVSGGQVTNNNTGNVSATAGNTGAVTATGGSGGATVAVGAAAVALLFQGTLTI
jgi:hypothetical protein